MNEIKLLKIDYRNMLTFTKVLFITGIIFDDEWKVRGSTYWNIPQHVQGNFIYLQNGCQTFALKLCIIPFISEAV